MGYPIMMVYFQFYKNIAELLNRDEDGEMGCF